MPDDEYSEDDEPTHFDEYSSILSYGFRAEPYDSDTFDQRVHEKDETIARELKVYYPELTDWPSRALATAWRRYSRDVGLVEEEYICVRAPNFLAYLFACQEQWAVDRDEWVNTLNEATRILWPDVSENDYSS